MIVGMSAYLSYNCKLPIIFPSRCYHAVSIVELADTMKDRQLLLSPAPPSAAPTVESPVTPHNSSAPASLSHALTSLKLEAAVSIEEVDCSSASGSCSGACSPDIQEALSAPHSPVKEGPGPILNSNQSKSLPRGSSNHYLLNSEHVYCDRPERPNELNKK